LYFVFNPSDGDIANYRFADLRTAFGIPLTCEVRGKFDDCGDEQMPFPILDQKFVERPIVPGQLPF
jgi:hypothetical protein